MSDLYTVAMQGGWHFLGHAPIRDLSASTQLFPQFFTRITGSGATGTQQPVISTAQMVVGDTLHITGVGISKVVSIVSATVVEIQDSLVTAGGEGIWFGRPPGARMAHMTWASFTGGGNPGVPGDIYVRLDGKAAVLDHSICHLLAGGALRAQASDPVDVRERYFVVDDLGKVMAIAPSAGGGEPVDAVEGMISYYGLEQR